MQKVSWQLDETDLLRMKRDKIQESLNMDFKRTASLGLEEGKKSEISKDVSAFANSEGGDILYGILESGNPPSAFDNIDTGIDPAIITPEWLEQVINSRIHPRIDDVLIQPIELITTQSGKYVYLVHIPASHKAPHQAYDKKYYKRFNFQSIAMEDYEIRDIRNRIITPTVKVEITGKRREPSVGWNAKGIARINLSLLLKNEGSRIAQQVYLECNFPSHYLWEPLVRIEGKKESLLIDNEQYRQLRYHHRDGTGSLPLFPRTDYEVFDGNRFFVHMQLNKDEAAASLDKFVYWTVYADGAEPTSGKVSIGELLKPL